MKIYIASSFDLIPRVEEMHKALEEDGHEITVKWWTRLKLKKELQPLEAFEFYNHPETEYAFTRDTEGVKEADALVFVADKVERGFNGANVELGIALGLDKPCLCWGVLPNSPLYFAVIFSDSIEEILLNLKDIERWGI